MSNRITPEEFEYLKGLTPAGCKSAVQSIGLRHWKENQYRGTLEMATGTGKTRAGVLAVADELAARPDAVIYILVPTVTLRDTDWPAEFKKWGQEHLLPYVKIICHVAMEKEKVPGEEVDLAIFDEIHNKTIINSSFYTNNKVYKTLGLTATLPSPDGYDMDKRRLIDDVAPSVFKVTVEEAIDLKLVSDFEVVVLKFDLNSTDYYVPGGSKAKPFLTTEEKQYKYLTKQLQKATYSKDPKMASLKFVWIQKRMAFLYSLKQKEILARDVMAKVMDKGKRTLIFCGGIEQANRLCGENVYHSKVGPEKLDQFQKGEIDYLGACQALNEGKNLDLLDQILIVQINSKELDIIQRIGRTIRFRPGHKARVIVLVARGTVDEKWYESAFENFDKKRITEHYVRPEVSPKAAA